MRDVGQNQTRGAAVIGPTSARKFVGKALLKRLRDLAVVVSAIGFAAPAVAGDLTITPSLEVRQEFSDNVDLDPDGEEQSALISELVPGDGRQKMGAAYDHTRLRWCNWHASSLRIRRSDGRVQREPRPC